MFIEKETKMSPFMEAYTKLRNGIPLDRDSRRIVRVAHLRAILRYAKDQGFTELQTVVAIDDYENSPES